MNQETNLKNIFEWYKNSIQNTLNIMNIYQQQVENLAQTFLAGSNLPDDSKKIIEEWFSFIRSSHTDFKESMDTGLKQLEIYLGSLFPKD
ncbi:MAG: hypothetical protein CSA18_04415 [Deltaproteobacteria bacterium]|nr:MAG: hypothetical protein CSA18_04415 [Deltaproteobacteria bacterium]